ncbi:MAG: hypothetical protein ACRESJ_30730, partial [Pseudomonas sp.]|uniref:hypothetical protein n=1 Tax=Pseudomonas sp. TaxID=306 RepID=UPI003D6DDF26
GKPAPTGFLVFTSDVGTKNLCGSGLARDGALTFAPEKTALRNTKHFLSYHPSGFRVLIRPI